MVSSDTVISITFGLISIAISLLGVWISYLTLRAMNIDAGFQDSMQCRADEVFKAMAFNLSTSKTKSFGMNTLSLYLLRGVGEEFLGWHETLLVYLNYEYEPGVWISWSNSRLAFLLGRRSTFTVSTL
ncbi:hypothetical protein L207DRAFT_565213 [Hyaloscypha variabilis F]|uniref:Uncharacterized protein n=1 Tax=Hyaloscypha variabilis (strain UAMH 11265 / GT02V1 / F) TaxID=1149755 RepID=A0A2J6RRY8_HYAVF|nr:hypothetical protein L207DRAFT_565213 [Hyaloscypha variabilis F]